MILITSLNNIQIQINYKERDGESKRDANVKMRNVNDQKKKRATKAEMTIS